MKKNKENTQLYVSKGRTLIKLDKDKMPQLFELVSDNWGNLLAEYKEANKDATLYARPSRLYLDDASYKKLLAQSNFPENTLKIPVGMASNQAIVYICGEKQKKMDDYIKNFKI